MAATTVLASERLSGTVQRAHRARKFTAPSMGSSIQTGHAPQGEVAFLQ